MAAGRSVCVCVYLGADHRGTLCNAAQGLAKVSAPAHEGNLEVVLVDVVHLVSWCQHLRNRPDDRHRNTEVTTLQA